MLKMSSKAQGHPGDALTNKEEEKIGTQSKVEMIQEQG